MAIAHLNSASNSIATANTSFSLTVPASGGTAGNLILMAIQQTGTSVKTFTFPTGYTQGFRWDSGASHGAYIFAWKISVGAGDAGAKSITSSASNIWSGVVSVFSGTNTTTPILATGSNNTASMSGTSLSMLAVTMTEANSYLYEFHHGYSVQCTFTTGTMTEVADANHASTVDGSFGAAYEAVAASGSTGTRTITASASQTLWTTFAIGINPAAAATTSFIWPTETTYRILSRR